VSAKPKPGAKPVKGKAVDITKADAVDLSKGNSDAADTAEDVTATDGKTAAKDTPVAKKTPGKAKAAGSPASNNAKKPAGGRPSGNQPRRKKRR
jgi:YidC/Oxa1 family membrane protein insertase